jgi:hypothetical protein
MLTKTNAPSLENFWMPFTANRQFKAAPRLLASASGMYYTMPTAIRFSTARLDCGAAMPAMAASALPKRRAPDFHHGFRADLPDGP